MKKKQPFVLSHLVIIWGALLLAGCSSLLNFGRTNKRYSPLPVYSSYPVHNYPNYSVGRYKIPYLAEQIVKVFKAKELKSKPLIILPLRELDEPEHLVSSFGCFFAEQLKTELYLNDFRVLYPGQELEEQIYLHLTLDLDHFLSAEENPVVSKLFYTGVEAVICGSYQVGQEYIYLNLRMILLENSEIISIGTCEIKKDQDLMALIEKKKVIKEAKSLSSPDENGLENGREFLGFQVQGQDEP